MNSKKTRVLKGRGSGNDSQDSGFFLSSRLLSGGIGAGSFMNAGCTLVFLAEFFDQAAGHEVLEFFISSQAEHFLTAAYGVAHLEIRENPFKKVVETKDLFFGQDIAKFISNMIWKAT